MDNVVADKQDSSTQTAAESNKSFDRADLWELTKIIGGEQGRIGDPIKTDHEKVELLSLSHPKAMAALEWLYERAKSKYDHMKSLEEKGADGVAINLVYADIRQMLGVVRAYNLSEAVFAAVKGTCIGGMGDERVVVIACRQATKESSSDELEEIKAGNEAIAECRAQEDDASYSNFVSKIPFVILGDCVKCRVKHNKCRARDYGATVTRGGLRGPAADLKLGLTAADQVLGSALSARAQVGVVLEYVKKGQINRAEALGKNIQQSLTLAVSALEVVKRLFETVRQEDKVEGVDESAILEDLNALAAVDEEDAVGRREQVEEVIALATSYVTKRSSTKAKKVVKGKGKKRSSSFESEGSDAETVASGGRRKAVRRSGENKTLPILPDPELLSSVAKAQRYLDKVKGKIEQSMEDTPSSYDTNSRDVLRLMLFDRYPELKNDFFEDCLRRWEKEEAEEAEAKKKQAEEAAAAKAAQEKDELDEDIAAAAGI